MSRERDRYTVTFDEGVKAAVEEYWHTHRLSSRNEAINALLKNGLESKNQLVPDERKLLEHYRNSPQIVKQMMQGALDYTKRCCSIDQTAGTAEDSQSYGD